MDHRFFKIIGYCFYCSFYCSSKNLGGKRLLGGTPLPPIAESQSCIPSAVMLLYLTASHIVVIYLDPISGTFLTDI